MNICRTNIKTQKWMFQTLVLVALMFLLVKTLYHFSSVILFPYDITNGEGFVLRDAYNSYKSIPIYRTADKYPFLVSTYPPLFAWLAGKIMLLTGPSFIATRLLSSLACFGLALAIAIYLKILKTSWYIAITASLFFLGSIYIFYWGAWSRVDTLAAFFSLASVVLVGYRQSVITILLASLCCIFAFYSKQSALASWFAISIYLISIYLFFKHKNYFFTLMVVSLFC